MSSDAYSQSAGNVVGDGTSAAATPSCEDPRPLERSACLILLAQRNEERVYPLRGHKWTIGRRPDRDVRIADPCVSSAHAEIVRRGPHYYIRDNGSTNGTLVNGVPIHERRLEPNDRIDLAGVATLVFATPGGVTGVTPVPVLTDDTRDDAADLPEAVRTERLIPLTEDEAARAARARSIAVSQAELAAEMAAQQPEGGESLDERRISILYQLAEALGTTRSEAGIFERTLDITLSLVPADRAMIFLGERMREGDAEAIPTAKRLRGGGPAAATAPASRTIIAEVLREGRAIGTADALLDERFSGAESVSQGRVRAVMAAPIATKNGVMGVLYLDTTAPGYFFSRAELMLVWAIAFQAALALENARFVRELERRMAVIEELAHVRGRLFAFAAHDLKTPLAALLGSLGGLLPRVEGDPASAWLAPELTTAAATVQRLVSLLDDLLLRQRSRGGGGLDQIPEAIEIDRLLQETAHDNKRWTDASRVQLEVRVPEALPRVRVDRRRVTCVLGNLVLHSIRRSPEGGRVVLEALPVGDSHVEIAVRDDGAAPVIPAIATGLDDGSSSGLAIIRELVAMLGGKLDIQSGEGAGVRFAFRLPVFPGGV